MVFGFGRSPCDLLISPIIVSNWRGKNVSSVSADIQQCSFGQSVRNSQLEWGPNNYNTSFLCRRLSYILTNHSDGLQCKWNFAPPFHLDMFMRCCSSRAKNPCHMFYLSADVQQCSFGQSAWNSQLEWGQNNWNTYPYQSVRWTSMQMKLCSTLPSWHVTRCCSSRAKSPCPY